MEFLIDLGYKLNVPYNTEYFGFFIAGFVSCFFITKVKVILWTFRKLKNQIKYLFRF